jgi:hypothetical protein
MATLFLFQNLITVCSFFLQIFVFALMTANLLLKAHAQTNPVVTTVLGNGGVTYLAVPVILNPVGGGTVAGVVPVVPGVGGGTVPGVVPVVPGVGGGTVPGVVPVVPGVGGGIVPGVVPVVPGVAAGTPGTTGLTQNFGVSKLLNIQ